jgi:hypothetical protein
MDFRAALADDNAPSWDQLTTKAFDAKSLGI